MQSEQRSWKSKKVIMKIDDKIRNEKMQYNVSREAAKISALYSGKVDRYEYLTSEEILPSDQSKIIEQFSLFSFRKTL